MSAAEKLAARFRFLDDLRESGVTNMYGSSIYVEEAFGLNRSSANATVQAWMRTFSRDKSPEQRAAEYLQTLPTKAAS